MKCFKIYDLAQALIIYFNKINKKKNKIIISKKNIGEKYEEELYSENEIPYIKLKNGLFIVTKNKSKHKKETVKYLKKHRVSNYNFINKVKILDLLIKLKILKKTLK